MSTTWVDVEMIDIMSKGTDRDPIRAAFDVMNVLLFDALHVLIRNEVKSFLKENGYVTLHNKVMREIKTITMDQYKSGERLTRKMLNHS